MNKNSIFVTTLWLFSIFLATESQSTSSLCDSKTSCSACIQTPKCAWCSNPDFYDSRCFQSGPNSAKKCDEKFVVYPKNEQNIIQNITLSRKSSASGNGKLVQISPQKVNLKLRLNEKHTITVKYARAEDYPVDLYYLMDLSSSMYDDKNKVSTLGDSLSNMLKTITSKAHLGFGSFVDKNISPFGAKTDYGFINQMKLSEDTKQFAKKVRESTVASGLDGPEGGFDAIMQAIVCETEIGWRSEARRLLVFAGDAEPHMAGDGKLGGIITPNDGRCHMAGKTYTHSTVQDYPSLALINRKVKENAINIIFTVTKDVHEKYKILSQHIEGSSSAVLSSDSSNVVEIIRDEYKKISSSVEMKDNAPTGSVKVTYFSKCRGKQRLQTSTCKGLTIGETVEFEAEIVVTSCPEDSKDRKQTFQIYPVGVGEALTVNLEILCSCDCETNGREVNSKHCKNAGTLSCGLCVCNEGHVGRNCECSNKDLGETTSDATKCGLKNETQVECNGRGNCVCGQCNCNSRDNSKELIYGKFCECDNFSCERVNGDLCSGPDHGVCDCGRCKCNDGWTSEACECSSSVETCKAPNDEICSGHGKCKCGQCECDKGDINYSGKYCEKCPTCSGRCSEFKNCVECQVFNKGKFANSDDCSGNCTLFTSVVNETLDYKEDSNEVLCKFYDEDDCRYEFVYSETFEENGTITLNVRARKNLICPKKVDPIVYILGVVGSIVIIGITTLLIWKILTTIYDRREFARFVNEQEKAQWGVDGNPLYKEATTTFRNPTFDTK